MFIMLIYRLETRREDINHQLLVTCCVPFDKLHGTFFVLFLFLASLGVICPEAA